MEVENRRHRTAASELNIVFFWEMVVCLAGEGATNVLPDNVVLGGTVRSLSEAAYLLLIERVIEVSRIKNSLHCSKGFCELIQQGRHVIL